MPPQPTERYGLIRIPAPGSSAVSVRYAPLTQRDMFDPAAWARKSLPESALYPEWWDFDIDALALPNGAYEYEFLLDSDASPIPDPYAGEITKFARYRGVFRTVDGQRAKQVFRWDDEFVAGARLPQNNEIVIYEMPVKWMSSDSSEGNALVELGTFEEIVFDHLDYLAKLGVNCIELLPIEDSSQTLDWGYGTRFYFAPDYDIGTTVDAKYFVKACHKRGIIPTRLKTDARPLAYSD